ncbi:substance-K receptor-like [Branchiostoma floridae x Branchiostoma japonicum]
MVDSPGDFNLSGMLPPDLSGASQAFQTAWIVSILIASVLSNLTVLAVVMCIEDLRQPTNYLLCALSGGQMLQVLVMAPQAAVLLTVAGAHMTEAACVVQGILFMVSITFTPCILGILSFDRYHYIVHPTEYRNRFTGRSVPTAIACTLLFTLTMAVVGLFQGNSYRLNAGLLVCTNSAAVSDVAFIVCILPAIGLITYSYVLIFKEARSHSRKILPSVCYDARLKDFKAKIKTAKTVMLAIVIFFLTWVSMVLAYVVSSSRVEPGPGDMLVLRMTSLIFLLSAFPNPILYACRNRFFRDAVKRLFRRTANAVKDMV